jgi:hypothetical protein
MERHQNLAGDPPPLHNDLVWGVQAIASEIGRTPRQTFHLIAAGTIPTGKAGGRIFASRSRLRQHFEALLRASESRGVA